jgi:hypothetical protein
MSSSSSGFGGVGGLKKLKNESAGRVFFTRRVRFVSAQKKK